MPTPRGFLFTGVVNDTIYAIGGGYLTSTNKNEAYDPVTNTWTTKANMPSPWLGVRGAVSNGKIYSIGGNYNAHNCFEYNPVTNTWTEKTPIPNDGGGALSATEYNGLIYTFGGSTYSPWAALSTVYAYNPQTDTWTKKRNMPTPRFAFKTFLVNGKIYAIGGCQSQSTTLATVEVYDPLTDTWAQGENMPINLGYMTGAVVNDKIYIIAGTPDFGNTGNYIVWEYDPTQDIIAQHGWLNKGLIPTPRAAMTASVIDNKIFVIGGNNGSPNFSDLDVNEVYDPAPNTWETKAPLPAPSGWPSSAVVNGIIYVIGGGYPSATNSMYAYDPVANSWSIKANLLSPRRAAQAGVVNGIIYNIGGNQSERNCEAYNPVTNTWIAKTSMPGAGGDIAVTVYNGWIYTFGGSGTGWQPYSDVYAYNPQTDTWVQKQSMPTERFGLQVYLIGNKIYAIGGSQSSGTSVGKVEVYYPDLDIWETRADMPITDNWFAGAVLNGKIYVIGGTPDGATGVLNVWEYDPAQDPTETPVELTSFTASADGKEVTLSWSTATELNNQGFEVQRKFGSNDFVTVGSVKGHGTTTSPNNYTYFDKLLSSGKYFYRLKQIDYGGKFEYSQEVEVNWSSFTTYKLEQNYPNPFNPTTTIGFGIPASPNPSEGGAFVTLKVYDVLGNEVKTLVNKEMEAGYHSIDFNASDLPSGVYFYQLRAGSFIEMKKMILLH